MKTVLFGIAFIVTLGLCPSLFGALEEESGVQGQMLNEVLDFGLIDHKGEFHRLKYYDGDESTRCIALFVHGNGCPLVRKRIPELNQLAAKYRGQGVKMALINSNFQDSRDEIVAEAEETGVQLPVLIDADQLVGEMLGLTRTAEMLLIDTKAWRIVFRGALDDRLNYERELSEARRHYFVDALESLLAGRTIDEPIVDTVGCRLTFPVRDKHQKDGLTYEKDVAPILMTKCVGCHSKGGIGPFALSSHRKVVGWSEMMEEVLLNRRMPPWQADPHYGRFQHSLSLTAEERQVLLHWLGGSMDRDQSVEDPLEQNIPVHKEWALGTPDQVITIPEQSIAATGIIDYLHIQMDLPFDQDVWVKGYDIRPGNTKVLHHIIAYILEMHDGQWERRGFLAGYAPGMGPEEFPLNSGVLLKQGQKLEFELHYTTCGTPEVDQSQMGLYLHKAAPEKPLHTGIIMDDSFRIPPQDGNFKHSRTTRIKQDIVLYSMNPHMHLRGKAMRFRVKMPDKSEQILLSVPDYNFNWQRNYRLTDPLRIPAGSVLTVDAAWDNSSLNTANPDPSRQVGWGDQSFDEMFFATYHFTVEAAENSSKSQFSLAD